MRWPWYLWAQLALAAISIACAVISVRCYARVRAMVWRPGDRYRRGRP